MAEIDGGRSLEDYALDYVRTRRSIREEEAEIKALKDNNNKAEQLAEHWQKVKDLRAEINGDDRVVKKKTKVADLKDKLEVLEEMVVMRLKEQ